VKEQRIIALAHHLAAHALDLASQVGQVGHGASRV
jgi:hypothetical protein